MIEFENCSAGPKKYKAVKFFKRLSSLFLNDFESVYNNFTPQEISIIKQARYAAIDEKTQTNSILEINSEQENAVLQSNLPGANLSHFFATNQNSDPNLSSAPNSDLKTTFQQKQALWQAKKNDMQNILHRHFTHRNLLHVNLETQKLLEKQIQNVKNHIASKEVKLLVSLG